MNNIIRNCIYQGKNLFRDGSFLFWGMTYPIIMAVFFYAAFNGMMNVNIEDINIGIKENKGISNILEEIDFINVHKIDESEVSEKLESGEIDAFVDGNLNLIVKKSGINQTIIKEVVEQIKQILKLNRPVDGSEFSVSYVTGKNQEANSIVVIFYSLIAMVSTYGIYAGIATASLVQANLSNIGIRINATPLRKENF